MKRPPRRQGEPILTWQHWYTIGGYGLLIGGSVLAVVLVLFPVRYVAGGGRHYLLADLQLRPSPPRFQHARSWYARASQRSGRHPYVWGAIGIGSVLMATAVWVPGLNTALQTVAPSGTGWGLIAVGSVVPLIVGQLVKIPAIRRLIPERLRR